MRLLSPALKTIVYPSLARIGYLRKNVIGQVSVVTYHGVIPAGYAIEDDVLDGALVSRENFIRQLRLLKSEYRVISPQQFLEAIMTQAPLPERAVLITCDDGLLNHVSDMLPVLEEEGLTCLFFITGRSVSEPYSLLWYIELYLMLMRSAKQRLRLSLPAGVVHASLTTVEERRQAWIILMRALSRLDESARKAKLSEACSDLGLPADWKAPYAEDPVIRRRFCVAGVPELRHLVECGMGIGAHSLSHPVPSEQPEELWRFEMTSSRDLLQGAIGQRVWAMAYPFGDAASVSQREYTMAEQAGFVCAFRNAGGPAVGLSSPFELPRIHVTSNMRLSEFQAHVSGFHDSLRKRLGRA